jgi:hypothetical protein
VKALILALRAPVKAGQTIRNQAAASQRSDSSDDAQPMTQFGEIVYQQ